MKTQTAIIDALLAHCHDAECSTCARIICPHDDEMHFHHDGCPSCFGEEQPTEIEFESGDTGQITKETKEEIYIESDFFTGWVKKSTFAKFVEE